MTVAQSETTVVERSASTQRLSILQSRLKALNDEKQEERLAYREDVMKGTQRVENVMQENQTYQKQQFSQLKDQFMLVSDAISYQKAQREILDDKKSKDIMIAQDFTLHEFQIQQQLRKQTDLTANDLIQRRFDDYETLLKEEDQNIHNTNMQLKEEIQEEVTKLLAEQEGYSREYADAFQNLSFTTARAFQQLKEELEAEKRERMKATDQCYNIFYDFVKNFQETLKVEREEREIVEDNLFMLLDETVKKLESTLQ